MRVKLHARLFCMLNIEVNGQKKSLAAGLTVAHLVDDMQLQGRRFAIERNGEIVPKSALDRVAIENGDRFEIVIAVGGG